MGAKDYEIGASLQPVFECLRLLLAQQHVGSAAGSSRWAYALMSGVCPARRRARRTASAMLEVAMQSAFQERFSYTMGPVGRGVGNGASDESFCGGE